MEATTSNTDHEQERAKETIPRKRGSESNVSLRPTSKMMKIVASPTDGKTSTKNTESKWVESISPNAIQVSKRQRGNPVLRYIRNIPFQFVDIVPDYVLGNGTCALFISIRFHLLHPAYLYRRVKELERAFRLRLILCLVDVEDNVRPLSEINKLAVLNDMTLILGWSSPEIARYLETFKAYENKSAASIQGRQEEDFFPRVVDALSCIRSVNSTDCATLLSTFGTIEGIFKASISQLLQCPGLGEKKVKRIYKALNDPFVSSKALGGPPPLSSSSSSSSLLPTTTNPTTSSVHVDDLASCNHSDSSLPFEE